MHLRLTTLVAPCAPSARRAIRGLTSVGTGALMVIALASCLGGGAVQKSAGGTTDSAGHYPDTAESRGGGSPESTTAQAEPAAQQRPGLGTQWGENLSSHVSSRQFRRAASAPFAALGIHYNDAEGVRAHTRHLGAYHLRPLRAYTPQRGISVALVDSHGNLLPGGEVSGRYLVEGRHGQRYNILIDNRSGGRYEVVASVDGIDVIDGRPADYAKRGYIIEPHSSLVIDGFRRSNSAVAAFRFGRVAASYAARTSGDRNVGVIGVAFFSERGSRWSQDWTRGELRRRDTADPFPGDRNYARPPGY